LLIRSLALVRSVSPGFDASRVLLVRVNLPLPVSPRWRQQEWALFQEIHARIAAIPSVARVGAIQDFLNTANPEEAITVEGSPGDGGHVLVNVTDTTPGFFEAMGVPLLRGRPFTPQEQNGTVTIVNQSFATRFMPGQDPIGKRLQEGDADAKGAWYTIVGVVGDMHRQGSSGIRPEYFTAARSLDGHRRQNERRPGAVAPAVRGRSTRQTWSS
jgi:hypothetical protein